MTRMKGMVLLIALLICSVGLIEPVSVFCKQNQQNMLMQKIREHIDQNTLHPAENVRIEFLSGLPKIDEASGKITFSIENRASEEYIGDTAFNVRIFSNGVFLREETVRVRIEVQRDFVVSLNTIAKNTVLSADEVTVQKKWVKRIPMNAISSLDDVIGKTIIVSIRPNAHITRSMLREVKSVKKGRMVQVVLDNGAMKIIMSGLAEEDGADDAFVKVRNLSSNKIIYARVVGPSKVQIDF